MCQLFLRELGKCSRLVQLIPMDMTGYFGNFTMLLLFIFICGDFFLNNFSKYCFFYNISFGNFKILQKIKTQ